MLSALAFVPVQYVEEYFEFICDNNVLPPDAQNVVDYFEDTWIGRPDRHGQRRLPLFPLRMWNCFETVEQGLPKTNNSLEGWHRGFQNQICGEHPNIWKFIEAIKREQSISELRIEQYVSGQEPAMSKRKYRDSAQRLARIVTNFVPNVNVQEYLRGIAHNVKF